MWAAIDRQIGSLALVSEWIAGASSLVPSISIQLFAKIPKKNGLLLPLSIYLYSSPFALLTRFILEIVEKFPVGLFEENGIMTPPEKIGKEKIVKVSPAGKADFLVADTASSSIGLPPDLFVVANLIVKILSRVVCSLGCCLGLLPTYLCSLIFLSRFFCLYSVR